MKHIYNNSKRIKKLITFNILQYQFQYQLKRV